MVSSVQTSQPLAVLTPLHVEAERLRRSFKAFVVDAWNVVEPETEFVDGWHIDAICECLQYTLEGYVQYKTWDAVGLQRIRKLVINIPPRCMKSLILAVFFPAWAWTRYPGLRFLFSSYSYDRSLDDSRKCRDVIQSPWYQARFGQMVRLKGNLNQAERFENTRTGRRLATSVGGIGTGEGGDFIITDDPNKREDTEGESDTTRKKTNDWWTKTMSTRGNNPRRFVKLVIQQRIHANDVSGASLATGEYASLVIPMEWENRTRTSLPYPWTDPRQGMAEGTLMWPERIGQTECDSLKRELGPFGTAGQLQQNPAPLEGGVIKREWLRFWIPANAPRSLYPLPEDFAGNVVQPRPSSFDACVISWDMTFKDTDGSDYVVGTVWGRKGADMYLLDMARDRMDVVRTMEEVVRLRTMWPQAYEVLIEDKANGPAVIQMLGRHVSGLVPVSPMGGKLARAYACAPAFHAGNVFLPHPAFTPWVQTYLQELLTFPNSARDDMVDSTTQAILRLVGDAVDRNRFRRIDLEDDDDEEAAMDHWVAERLGVRPAADREQAWLREDEEEPESVFL